MTSGMPLVVSVKNEAAKEIMLNMPMIFISCQRPDKRLERLSSRLQFIEANEKVDFDNLIDYNDYITFD
jgi:hypothetical protein